VKWPFRCWCVKLFTHCTTAVLNLSRLIVFICWSVTNWPTESAVLFTGGRLLVLSNNAADWLMLHALNERRRFPSGSVCVICIVHASGAVLFNSWHCHTRTFTLLPVDQFWGHNSKLCKKCTVALEQKDVRTSVLLPVSKTVRDNDNPLSEMLCITHTAYVWIVIIIINKNLYQLQ